MQVVCWASAPMPTLPPSCVFRCVFHSVTSSSKAVSASGPHGSQARGKSCRKGRRVQGEGLAHHAVQYISRWISAWTGD